MLTDAAIASVDLSDVLSVNGRTREIAKVLSGVVETFTAAGKLTGALTALAFLRDAALAGKLNAPLLTYAKRYIARSETQPQLVFAPPPQP